MLFVAERDVPLGLASLVIASVPLVVVALRARRRRPAHVAARSCGVAIGFAGIGCSSGRAETRRAGGFALDLGSAARLGGRLVPVRAAAGAE